MGPEAALMAATIAAVSSTAIGTVQGLQQASAASAAETANAQIAEQNAALAREKAVAREISVRRENRRVLAQRSAAMAESGLETTGSMAAGFEDSAMLGEYDALLTRHAGVLDARGFDFDAEAARTRASNIRRTKPVTFLSGVVGAGTQALSGAANMQLYRRLPGTGGGVMNMSSVMNRSFGG